MKNLKRVFCLLAIFLLLSSSYGITQTTQKVLNYPNPFTPPSQSTIMSYDLDENSDTKIYILNSVGQVVRKLSFSSGANGGKLGGNTATWDGLSNFGAVVPNGIYLLRIISGGGLAGKGKIVVLN